MSKKQSNKTKATKKASSEAPAKTTKTRGSAKQVTAPATAPRRRTLPRIDDPFRPARILLLVDRWSSGGIENTVVDLAELGRNLGVGGAGRNAPLVRSLRRLELFGGASWNGEIYAVRRALAPISERQLQRLPTLAKNVHRRAQQRQDPNIRTTPATA